jgi:hypothetical protein
VITADTLHDWADAICRWTGGGRAEATAMVGGALRVERADHASVEPPPEGATRLRIYDDMATHSVLDYLDVELAAPGLSRAELEARFGPGELSPRVSATSPHKLRLRVDPDGTPCTCDVYAVFTDKPQADTRARTVTLRRNGR